MVTCNGEIKSTLFLDDLLYRQCSVYSNQQTKSFQLASVVKCSLTAQPLNRRCDEMKWNVVWSSQKNVVFYDEPSFQIHLSQWRYRHTWSRKVLARVATRGVLSTWVLNDIFKKLHRSHDVFVLQRAYKHKQVISSWSFRRHMTFFSVSSAGITWHLSKIFQI